MKYLTNIYNAVEYIESNLSKVLILNEISRAASFSEFHFFRIFKAIVNETIGEYIRRRRLTIAARQLTSSNDDIYIIALDSHFESQEAFTRAFKKQFGVTPGKYRNKGKNAFVFERTPLTLEKLKHYLKGGIVMEPKIVEKEKFIVVGMECRTTMSDNKIPELWQKFLPRSGEIKNIKNPGVFYGICQYEEGFLVNDFTENTEFTELVCAEVTDDSNLPEGMVSRIIPTQKYAVFTHKGDVTKLKHTYDYIYGKWAIKSDYEIAEADEFELYDDRFNYMEQEKSEIDIYIPIK